MVLCLAAARLAAEPLTVQLDWITNAQFAGVLVAAQKGYYKEVGIDITVLPVDLKSMTSAVAQVATGAPVVGVADGLVLLNARRDHQPIRAFGTMLQASPLCIMTLRSGPIRTFAELRGKRIGLHTYDHMQLRIMLAANHMTEADVTTIDTQDDLVSLIAGRFDAQVAYAIDEKVAVELKGHPTRTFAAADNGFVAYSQVYFTSEAMLRDHAPLLTRFLAATNRGWKDAFAHPKATAGLIVDHFLPGGDVDYQERSLEELEHVATAESPRLGAMRLETWQKSCAVFGLPPSLAAELADFDILRGLAD